ncbi:hypothetical protein D3C80_1878700 [compost metagenome]
MIKHAGVSEVAKRHVDAQQNGGYRQDLHCNEDRHEIGGIAEVGECLTNPVSFNQVHRR